MMNNLLNVIVLGSLTGTFFIFAPTSEPRPVAPLPSPPRVAVAASPAVSTVPATVTSQQPPIPLVRSQRVSPAVAVVPEARTVDTGRQPQDGSDRTAAMGAIEADGYKGVTLIAKGADGTWRAKAYRGKDEVRLIVDGMGKVSTE